MPPATWYALENVRFPSSLQLWTLQSCVDLNVAWQRGGGVSGPPDPMSTVPCRGPEALKRPSAVPLVSPNRAKSEDSLCCFKTKLRCVLGNDPLCFDAEKVFQHISQFPKVSDV